MLNLARVLVLICALCAIALGLLLGGLSILMALVDPSADLLSMVTVGASILVLALGFGLALAWQAGQAIRGQASGPFQPKRMWLWMLLFLLAVLLGQAVLALDVLPSLVFPPFHIAAAILPSVITVGIVGRGLGPTTRWREMVLQVSSGTILATCLAFSLEFVIILGLVFLIVLLITMQPGGLELVQSALERLQDPAWVQDPANLSSLGERPLVLVGALLVFAGIIPLLEETVKTIGVPLMAYRRPGLAQAYLWGVAGGAGFALAEALFNSVAGLDLWSAVVLMRVGATMLHCFTGGLMGMAWYFALRERRWLRSLGLYAASVAVHALWNALAAGMTFVSLSALGGEGTDATLGVAGIGIAGMLVLLLILALTMALGLVGLTRYVKHRSEGTGSPNQPGATKPVPLIQPEPSLSIQDAQEPLVESSLLDFD